jgi:hypothetical protein
MKGLIFYLFIATAFLIYISEATGQSKPQVIILTDIGGDTDDEQSMVRFLLYANEFDVKSIGITSRMGHQHDIRPEIMFNLIEGYRQVYPNLKLHADGYPSADYLASIVKNGQGDPESLGEGHDSEASDHIIKVVDEATEKVHIAIWGGQRELAQALLKVQQTRKAEEVQAFCEKIQVHAIGDQDGHRNLVMDTFKHITYIADGYAWRVKFGDRELSAFRGMYMTGDISMQDGDWVRKNIHGHGPLSAGYQLNGHGTNGMKEGDSPSFLGLIRNGLNVPERPDWGGWGGRYRLLRGQLYVDAPDFLFGEMNERHSVARWRKAFQHDFMARIKWCVEPYDRANHNPEVVVNGVPGHKPLIVKTKAGEKLNFDASASSDPDGNTLRYRWYFYDEISLPEGAKVNPKSGGKKCRVDIPANLRNRTIHLILEVSDDGSPSLTTYRRIVIHVS